MELGYRNGADRVDYPFQTRGDAFRFQQLLTGYRTVEQIESVACVVAYKKSWLRHHQYVGFGEIQLWQQAEEEELSNDSALPSLVSSLSSRQSFPNSSIHTHTDDGRSIVIVRRPQPPLLVAFLKDKDNDDRYTMLKVQSKYFT